MPSSGLKIYAPGNVGIDPQNNRAYIHCISVETCCLSVPPNGGTLDFICNHSI